MSKEQKIYLIMKDYLLNNEWVLLGGEPPDGTDTIPRIEIKESNETAKGSKGSKKIDLIAFKNNYFLLIELKDKFDIADVNKLSNIVENKRESFIKALKEKKILEKNFIKIDEKQYIGSSYFFVKSIAYIGEGDIPTNFIVFNIKNDEIKLSYGDNIRQEIKRLF